MRRRPNGVGGLRLLLAAGLLLAAAPGAAPTGAAQDGKIDPTATRIAEEAELEGLRTQVAGLATEVAELRGGEEALAGRLGGVRGSFADASGPPVLYLGADQLAFDVPRVGRLVASFADDRADRLVVSPPRPVDKPSAEADRADWGLDEAL